MPLVHRSPDDYRSARASRRAQASRARRVFAVLAVLVLVGGLLVYRRWASPARISETAQRYLEMLTGGDVRIGSASFSLWKGVRLGAVEVSLPQDTTFFATSDGSEPDATPDRRVFCADEIRLRPDILSMLSGEIVVHSILATNAEVTLVRRMDDGWHNWQALLASRSISGPLDRDLLPRVRLRDSTIHLLKLTENGTQQLDAVRLTAVAVPARGERMSYRVKWQQRGEPAREGVLRIDLDPPGVAAESGGLPNLNVGAVLTAMPGNVEAFSEWLGLLELQGTIDVESLSLGASTLSEARVGLNSMALSIPLDELERFLPADQRFVRLEQVEGELRWKASEVAVNLTGCLNGERCELDGRLFVTEGQRASWSDVGFDLMLNVHRFKLPQVRLEGGGPIASLVERFDAIRYAFERYDPHGDVEITLRVRRAPTEFSGVKVQYCEIRPLGADVMYAAFPVRVRDLRGSIRIEEDGAASWDLTGDYHGGRVQVRGWSPRISPYAAVDLTIEGVGIPLDEELYGALQPAYQAIWKRFSPWGHVDTRVQVCRDDTPLPPTDPFRSDVEIDFLGVEARFDSFPYPVEDVRGRVTVGPDGIEVHSLSGRRGPATVAVTGRGVPDERGGNQINLELTVSNMELDSELVSCLPIEAQQAVCRFGLTGRADLSGSITNRPNGGPIAFDLMGRFVNGTARHERFPVKLRDVEGSFQIRPDQVRLIGWEGRLGDATVEAAGTLWMGVDQTQSPTSWTVHCRSIECVGDVRESLPAEVLEAWDRVGVKGPLDVEMEFGQGGSDKAADYRVTLFARDNTVEPQVFPWSLDAVTGRVVITPRTVELQGLHGRHGSGEVAVHGWCDRDSLRAMLSVHAENVALDEELRQAVPWRVRRNWNIIQPAGAVDLHLNRLELTTDTAGARSWRYQGSAVVHDLSLRGGIPLEGVDGTIRGAGTVLPEGRWELGGQMALERCRVKRHLLENVKGTITRRTDPDVLEFAELQASVHGGQAVGRLGVRFGPEGGYEFSLVAQDMALEPFLDALAGAEQTPRPIYGTVQGKLFYASEFDRPGEGRGGGDLHVRGGALFRLPLMLSVLRALDPVPAVGMYQDANVRFMIDGALVSFQAISIRDRSLLLAGDGTLRLGPDKNLDVVLLAGEALDRSTPLTAVQEFVRGALREIIEVRIRGSLEEPGIESRPLRSVDNALRLLFQSRQDAGP